MQKSYSELLNERNEQIAFLRSRLKAYQRIDTLSAAEMTRECVAVVENIEKVSMGRQVVYDDAGRSVDTVIVCVVKPKQQLTDVELSRLERWLKVRGNNENVLIYVRE